MHSRKKGSKTLSRLRAAQASGSGRGARVVACGRGVFEECQVG